MAQRIQKILNRSGLYTYWSSGWDNPDNYHLNFLTQEVLIKIINTFVADSTFRDFFLLKKFNQKRLIKDVTSISNESDVNLNYFLKKNRAMKASHNCLIFATKTWYFLYNNECYLSIFLYKSVKSSEQRVNFFKKKKIPKIKKYIKYKTLKNGMLKNRPRTQNFVTWKINLANAAPHLFYYYKKIFQKPRSLIKAARLKKFKKKKFTRVERNVNLWSWSNLKKKKIFFSGNFGALKLKKYNKYEAAELTSLKKKILNPRI